MADFQRDGGPRDSQQGLRGVKSERVAPRGAVGFAVLISPSDRAAEEDTGDHQRVRDHDAGSEQHRNDRLKRRADDQPEPAAERAADGGGENPADDREHLRHEQQSENSCGQDDALGDAIDAEPAGGVVFEGQVA